MLNMKEVPSAVRTLLRALEEYREKDQAITEFHRNAARKQTESQSQSQSAVKEAA
jgi:hypothetical protein